MGRLRAILDEIQSPITGETDGLAKLEMAKKTLAELPMGEDWLSFQTAIANIYGRLPSKNRAQYLENAIERYQLVLEHRAKSKDRIAWARTRHNLGTAWRDRLNGNSSDNRKRAVLCYYDALTVYTKKIDRFAWGAVHNSLGNAYSVQIDGDPQEFVELAIKHVGLALRAYTADYDARLHARCKANLARLYQLRHVGDKSSNLERSIMHAQDGLKAIGGGIGNIDHANLHVALAVGYMKRDRGYPKRNYLKSLTHYEMANRILVKDEYPREWARLQFNRAIAYRYPPVGSVPANSERARKLLEEALEIYTAEAFPEMWIKVQQALCDTLAVLKDWHGVVRVASEVIEKARKLQHGINDLYESRRILASISPVKNLKVLGLTHVADEKAAFAAFLDHRAEIFGAERRKQISQSTVNENLTKCDARIHFCIQPLFKEPTLVFLETIENADQKVELIRLDALSNWDLGKIIETDSEYPELTWMSGYEQFKQDNNPSHFMQSMDHACGQLSTRLKPLMDRLQKLTGTVRNIQISASGAFNLIPFSILFLDDAHKERIIDHFTVEYLSGVPGHSTSLVPTHGENRIMAIVDPRDNLKFASLEVDLIAESKMCLQSLKGKKAEKSAVADFIGKLTGGDILHFICHGHYSWRHPEVSHLELAGEENLSLHDIAKEVQLPGGVRVTLSACETGISEFQSLPEETYGLPLAFLAAGAEQVMSPLWPVSDYMTSQLMGLYYGHLQNGMTGAEVLRKAQLEIRDRMEASSQTVIDSQEIRWGHHQKSAKGEKNNSPDLHHPYFWGGFAVLS